MRVAKRQQICSSEHENIPKCKNVNLSLIKTIFAIFIWAIFDCRYFNEMCLQFMPLHFNLLDALSTHLMILK